MGVKARSETQTTMEMMPNFFASFENVFALSGSAVLSASTELISALIPMQEIPQTMLQMASFLWCSSSQQQEAALGPALMIAGVFCVSPAPGTVVRRIATSSTASRFRGDLDISADLNCKSSVFSEFLSCPECDPE